MDLDILMERTLILYESKYGFTEYISKNLSLILGPARYCRVSEFKEDFKKFSAIVICTPVYLESVDKNIIEFVSKNAEWIKQKKVILLCSCLAKNLVDKYLKPLNDILGNSVCLQSYIGGELVLSKLSGEDYKLMKSFSDKTGFPLNDCKLFEKNTFVELALNIKNLKDKSSKMLNEQELKVYITDFIKNHNTCALATGHNEAIRSTPIEYIYLDECIYIVSEGGEKFANIIINQNVSISIFESYKSMSKLAGMQIAGTAEIIEIGSDEYISAMKNRGLNIEEMISLPVALNLIKVHIKKIEFLWSAFAELGYDTKQILNTCIK
jgi:menaquinone-dependent protoporphyrinogen IX oxidase/uncharacterized protein YhbP (UPF0306 family)